MKIIDVTLTLFAWDGIPETNYGPHKRFGGSSTLGLLAIDTDEGVTGHAFLGTSRQPADLDGPALMRALKPVLIGRDPLDRERLYQELWRRVRVTNTRSVGAVDVALWDIAGKTACLPIYKLLGACRSRAPAYASSPILHSVEAYAEEAAHYKSLSWPAYKVHPPQSWRDDIQVCEAVRKAVGDSYTLMLDPGWCYDYPAALRVGLAIEALDYYWYEDPLADQDLYNYVKLKQKLRIPIMATEYPQAGLDAYAIWITSGATDFLRGDVAHKGGITAMMKAAHLAEAFHLNYEIHHGGNSLNNVANLHVLMAIHNSEFFEVFLPDSAQKYGLVKDIDVDSEGYVHAPTGPGLGAEIDFDLIEHKKVAVLR
ncbi:MAG: mandelate racemase [Betaproteobacteria bacterium RIFCSPLOWO2_12_FULL_62_58]|nr:MAG: mandelate racemase [Betaproteobacteria bacterium RIFCSPLOWO2_12_FULL_62_58]